MKFWILWALYMLIVLTLLLGTIIWMLLAARALWKWVTVKPKLNKEDIVKKTLGEVLKENRVRCNMTQEFVAESLGVSRQAVSKWEKGTSNPSTTNLIALSKLYETSMGEILKCVEKGRT